MDLDQTELTLSLVVILTPPRGTGEESREVDQGERSRLVESGRRRERGRRSGETGRKGGKPRVVGCMYVRTLLCIIFGYYWRVQTKRVEEGAEGERGQREYGGEEGGLERLPKDELGRQRMVV